MRLQEVDEGVKLDEVQGPLHLWVTQVRERGGLLLVNKG